MLARRSEDTRDRLLETAIEHFSERGYNGVSVRDIATAVGITPPALYNHFPNKAALYRAAVAAAFEEKAQRMLEALERPGSPAKRLTDFLLVAASEIRHSPAFRRLVDRELLDGDGERLAFLGDAVFARIQIPFMALLRELSPDCDALLLSEMVLGMLKQHDAMEDLHPHLALEEPARRDPQQIAALALAMLRGPLGLEEGA